MSEEEALALGWKSRGKKCAAGGTQKLQLVATNCFRCRHFGAL